MTDFRDIEQLLQEPHNSLLSKLKPKNIGKEAAVDLIKKTAPLIQRGIELIADTAVPVIGLGTVFQLISTILSYYERESKLSETITSLGVLVANVGASLALLVTNPELEMLIGGLETVLLDIKSVIHDEKMALKGKGFHKVLHVFSKADKVEGRILVFQDKLARATGDLDFRLQIKTHNSIEQIAEDFILLRVTVEDRFAGLTKRIGSGNEKIMVLLAEILESQTAAHADIHLDDEVYAYFGSLTEDNGALDERPIHSKDLVIASIRQDIKESYEPKLDDCDGFTLKLRYLDKRAKATRTVDVNPRMLKTIIGSRRYEDVTMLIERNSTGYAPFENDTKKRVVVKEGESTVIISIDPETTQNFEDAQREISASTDIYLTSDSTIILENGTHFAVSGILAALNDDDGNDEIVVQLPVPPVQEIHSDELEPLHLVSYSSIAEFDVMVSYCWKTSRVLVKRVVEELRERGLTVWFDEDEMHNSILDRMAEAISKSKVFCMFLNTDYQESYNCQLEYGFAAAKKKPIVTARDTTDELKPDGAALLAGSNLYSDFSGEFDKPFDLLYKNIQSALEPILLRDVSRKTAATLRSNTSIDYLFAWLNPVDFSDDLLKFEEAYVPPTRQWMLRNLTDWVKNDTQSVLCLLGGAGVGKSVFAWLAHNYPTEYISPAIFFCRHNNERKNNAKNIVSSLAYQLAYYSPEFKSYLFDVQSNEAKEQASNLDMIPLIQRSDSFKTLILDGLHHIKVPDGKNLLFVIDALDECERPGSIGRVNLLLTIKDYHKKLPKGIKLLVTSRPEEDIVMALEAIKPDEMLIRQQHAIQDVFIYFEFKFHKLCSDAGVEYTDDIRDAAARLADASQGVFVFAALACQQFAEMRARNRGDFRARLLQGVETLSEGGGNMDSIYIPFLNSHYSNADDHDFVMFAAFMGIVTAVSVALSAEAIALILNIPVYVVDAVVLRIGSILHLQGGRIRVLHKSVKDFLTSRCVDKRFRVSIKKYHDLIASKCFKLVLLTADPENDELVEYANSYWTYHLSAGNFSQEHIENLNKMVIEDGAFRLIAWFKGLLHSNTRTAVAQKQIMKYLAKMKDFESMKAIANMLEMVFNLAFLSFGDTFKASEWKSRVASFRETVQHATHIIDESSLEENASYDFYISYEQSSSDVAISLLGQLQNRGYTVSLMTHSTDNALLLKDRARMLNSLVYLVVVTQKYEASKLCQMDFTYARTHERGMFGVFAELDSFVRGDSSTHLKSEFWTTTLTNPNEFEIPSEFDQIPLFFKMKNSLQFPSWRQFRMSLELSIKRSNSAKEFARAGNLVSGAGHYKDL
ncbi:UNVERIFIED_CONTAM: hypothetical protein HDU68_011064 [Siphonaria sp. JEL0065]|nr:hypothetical protein HDU68_011064 [Siphonaria sp. JEL0065]